ncbi:MAG: NAD-binding protein [TACK group archaeon]|nr:NAD-binding protein [TACK group archaeon]
MGKLYEAAYMLFYTPFLVAKKIKVQLLALAAMFGFGMVLFMYYQDLDPLTALLASVSTITTIGLYSPNLVTIPSSEKVLLIITFITSVGLAASIVQTTVSSAVRRELLAEESAKLKVKAMNGHVIVMGYKYLGKYVVESLNNLGLSYVVLVRDSSQLDALRLDGIPAMSAPVTHTYKALLDAGVQKASALISTFEDDGDNMLVVLNAKKLNPNLKVITVVNDRELVEGAQAAGADVALVPSELMGNILALSTISDEVEGVFLTNELRSRHVAAFEVKVSGIKYADVKGICPVLFAKRGDEIIYDLTDDMELKPGDKVYVMTDHESLAAFRDKMRGLNLIDKEGEA